MQIGMFDGNEGFKIDKPIRLIELFGGYGSQHFSLEYLGVEFEQWKLCEWAVKSIQAYKDAHFENDNNDYSKDLSDSQVLDYLFNKGISQNYNEPMTYEQIKRLGVAKQRQIYNNIKATHNLVNIQQTRGGDLEIVDTDKYCYIMTYSFPCQDLSSAGLGKGMEKGSGTRSGMLWEVERLLDECKEIGNLPQVLLMENVPEVIGANNVKHFAEWLKKLENLGYHCYWQVLNAKDYGVPQNRERCFMISILGDYYYYFPQPIKLKHKLKDLLEYEVDEKYYLSDKAINGIQNTKFNCSTLDARTEKNGVMPTLCARDYKDPKLVVEYLGTYEYTKSEKFMQGKDRLNIGNEISGTIQTTHSDGIAYTDCRIRKLTPKECFRLMGVKDEDFEKIAKNQSNASLYHLAGDSIVVDVLMAIFKNML